MCKKPLEWKKLSAPAVSIKSGEGSILANVHPTCLNREWIIGQILWQLESGVRGPSFPKQLLGT